MPDDMFPYKGLSAEQIIVQSLEQNCFLVQTPDCNCIIVKCSRLFFYCYFYQTRAKKENGFVGFHSLLMLLNKVSLYSDLQKQHCGKEPLEERNSIVVSCAVFHSCGNPWLQPATITAGLSDLLENISTDYFEIPPRFKSTYIERLFERTSILKHVSTTSVTSAVHNAAPKFSLKTTK